MTTTTSLTERRRVLSRIANSLVQKSGPLNPSEREQFRQIHQQIAELESDMQSHAQREYSQAFNAYLRHGFHRTEDSAGISAEMRSVLESRDMGTGGKGAYPGSTNGFFVPAEFAGKVISAMKAVTPLFETSTVFETSTGRIEGFPQDDDTTATGERIGESQQVTQQDIQNITQTLLGAYKYSSRLVKVSVELATDAGFDLSAYLAQRLGIRLGRILGTELTTGTGTTMPNGLVTMAPVGANAVGTSPDDGSSAATNTIGSNDLINLIESVDEVYRQSPSVGFELHSTTLSAIKKLRDKQGRLMHLFKPARQNPSGMDLLCGYPCYVNPAMSQLQTQASSPQVSVKSVIFGALDRYIIKRTPLIVLRLEERFIDQLQYGFLCLVRVDGALIDGGGGAVKSLQNAF